MRLTRCYVPDALHCGDTVSLPESTSSHIGRVLRARTGESLTLFDGRGGEYDAQILAIDRRLVREYGSAIIAMSSVNRRYG